MKRTPTPASWTHSPLAIALLASCAHDPPGRRTVCYRFGDIASHYAGERVRALKCLYRAAQPPLDTAAWRAWLAFDVERAIDRALAAAASRTRAA